MMVNLKLVIVLLEFVGVLGVALLIIRHLSRLEHVTFPDAYPLEMHSTTLSTPPALNGKKILLVNTQKKFGGGEVYTASLYKNLLKYGFDASIFVLKDSWLEKKLTQQQLPYYVTSSFFFGFASNLFQICHDRNINLIHCNVTREIPPARQVATTMPIRVVLTKHIPQAFPPFALQNLDGLVAVSTQIKKQVEFQNQIEDLAIQNIVWVPPFFEEEKFITHESPEKRAIQAKKEVYGDGPRPGTLVCNITNMSRDKNPHLLIKALSILRNERKKDLRAIFAGAGNQLNRLKELAKTYDVHYHTHFPGYVDNTPLFLLLSDVVAITSKQEGFGIVLLEASLLKKPLIGPSGTGVEDFITHNETGILYENNNEHALADAIEKILEDLELRNRLIDNAYERARHEFCIEKTLSKLINFYATVLA